MAKAKKALEVKEIGIPAENRGSVVEQLATAYERMQKYRVALDLHLRSAPAIEENPVNVIRDMVEHTEREALRLIVRILKGDPTFGWLTSIRGVGEVMAAKVMGKFPIEKFASPGKMWALAGLVPGRTSYSRSHKAVSYQLTMTQVMTHGDYRPWYEKRKAYEWRRNLNGELADQATNLLKQRDWRGDKGATLWLKGKVSPEWAAKIVMSGSGFPMRPEVDEKNGVPMLPPSIIEARARRWLAKLMLDHYFQVAYWYKTGERWVPWVIAHGGHVDKIEPVNAPWLIEPVNKPWR